jgi:DNA-binding response OmpR family regulator
MVLLDAMMPGRNGLSVAERICNGSEFSHVPIIVMTVLSSAEDRSGAFEAGGNDFVGKPIDRWDLKARIESLFKLQEGQAETGA